MIASLEQIASLLQNQGVRFIVIGGWAAIIHGSARTTNDVDLVYSRDADNIAGWPRPSGRASRTCGEYRQDCPSGGTNAPFKQA